MTVNILLFKITLLVYFVATIFYLIGVISRKERFRQNAVYLLIGGFILHCITLAVRWVATGAIPVASLHESLSYFALAMGGIYLIFNLRYRTVMLGEFITPNSLVQMSLATTT